jgi:hypothetical protein
MTGWSWLLVIKYHLLSRARAIAKIVRARVQETEENRRMREAKLFHIADRRRPTEEALPTESICGGVA